MFIYTLRCGYTGESQEIPVCDHCAENMPHVDGEWVTAYPADDDIECDFCDDLGPVKGLLKYDW